MSDEPMVTLRHKEYAYLLEVEKAFKELQNGGNKVILYKHSSGSRYGVMDSKEYIVKNPTDLQKALIENIEKLCERLEKLDGIRKVVDRNYEHLKELKDAKK